MEHRLSWQQAAARWTRWACALAAAGVVSAAVEARADDAPMKPEAKAHLDRGIELYQAKDYPAAIAEFEKGYALDPRPELLYAQAQAERLAGRCDAAIPHYEKLLESHPEPDREAAARANLAKCKEELAAKTPPAPAPTPVPAPVPAPAPAATPEPKPAPAVPRREASPWYTDVLGDTLVGTGVIALGVGTFFYLSSAKHEQDARAASSTPGKGSYQDQLDRLERAERQRTLGVVLGGAGLALIGGGVFRYLTRDDGSGPAVGGWWTHQSAGAAVGGRF